MRIVWLILFFIYVFPFIISAAKYFDVCISKNTDFNEKEEMKNEIIEEASQNFRKLASYTFFIIVGFFLGFKGHKK